MERAHILTWPLVFFLLLVADSISGLLKHTDAKKPFLWQFKHVLPIAGNTNCLLGVQVDLPHLRQKPDLGVLLDLDRTR